jgi:hypothetical protein
VLVLPTPAQWIDGHYARLYGAWQRVMTAALDRLPVAPFDLWLGAAAVAAVAVIVIGWRRGRKDGRGRAVWRAGTAVLSLVSVVYLWFMASWGLNYRRAPLTTRLGVNRSRVTAAAVQDLAAQSVAELNRLHPQAWALGWPGWREVPAVLAPAIAPVSSWLGLPAPQPGTPRRSLLQPYLRSAAIDGVTNPFLLDVIVNDDALPVERPATLAHEWGHLAGLAREAEASYYGWRLCRAGDARAQYSAWLFIYGYAMRAVPPPNRADLMRRLAPGPLHDLRAIAARYERVVPAVRDAAWRTYDRYLKSNRVPEGVASYDEVLVLVIGAPADR